MEKISIKVPEGYEVVVLNGTIEVRKKETNWLPKTWEEFCANNPIKEGEFFVNAGCMISKLNKGRQRRPIVDANLLPNKEYAEAILALCKLIQLRDCYNDGWQPDWESREDKYSICIDQNKVQVVTSDKLSRLLTFKTPIIREMFYMNFKDIIEKAKILL